MWSWVGQPLLKSLGQVPLLLNPFPTGFPVGSLLPHCSSTACHMEGGGGAGVKRKRRWDFPPCSSMPWSPRAWLRRLHFSPHSLLDLVLVVCSLKAAAVRCWRGGRKRTWDFPQEQHVPLLLGAWLRYPHCCLYLPLSLGAPSY